MINQQVMRARNLQECDVQEKGGATDLLRQWPGTKYYCSNGIPDGHMGSNINLL
jgi:hypothetical protein